VTAEPEEVLSAERIVLPGVGAFADCRRGLERVPGMIEALEEAVHERGKPFFGICVGLQLMAERGHENGLTPGLGWIEGEVRAIEPSDSSLKIPHMGLEHAEARAHPRSVRRHPYRRAGPQRLFRALLSSRAERPSRACREHDYGGEVTAFVAKDNMAGSQFHPEKSQKLGLALIANFLKWKP
jgi:glutamine amidotransferase